MTTKILNFIDQVKKEGNKISWSSKKEVSTSTIVVVVAVIITSMFFLLVDMLVHNLVQYLLSIGS